MGPEKKGQHQRIALGFEDRLIDWIINSTLKKNTLYFIFIKIFIEV